MINRTTKLRWRRRLRDSRRQVEDLGLQVEEQIERHIWRRFGRLVEVKRFVIIWLFAALFMATTIVIQTLNLSDHYQRLQPVSGGIFTEGILGSYTDTNPIYASSMVDSSVAKLIFSSLLKTDGQNRLVGDLAESWHSDEAAKSYTVKLRPGLKWHDGSPLTAEDVVFTYNIIKNPDTKSPLGNSFRGINIVAIDAQTIIFSLPSSLSSFAYSLTNGIIPKKYLKDVPISQLRSIRFNTVSPVGSGPFKMDRVEVDGNTPETREERVGLKAYENYHFGRPQIDQIIIRAIHNQTNLIEKFKDGQLDAVIGLDSLPDNAISIDDYRTKVLALSGQVVVFFKTTNEILKSQPVRQALAQSIDKTKILAAFSSPPISLEQPFFPGQLGYDKKYDQLGLNVAEANKLLDSDGWKKEGVYRVKNKQILALRFLGQNSVDNVLVSQKLQEMWLKLGVKLEVRLEEPEDFQNLVAAHDYDILLNAISIGPDPDVFAYWHSSQSDPRSAYRLNFSEYRSGAADKSLEAGRTRSDQSLRTIKYAPFSEAWQKDVPAYILYQPRLVYFLRKPIFGFDNQIANSVADRYSSVHTWKVRQAKVNY